jgi:hypothetical protein
MLMLHRWAWLPVLLLALFVSKPAWGHTIEVQASQKECFFEDLHIHDKVKLLRACNGTEQGC